MSNETKPDPKSAEELQSRIEKLESLNRKYLMFLSGIKPYLFAEGYYGFVENVDELIGLQNKINEK